MLCGALCPRCCFCCCCTDGMLYSLPLPQIEEAQVRLPGSSKCHTDAANTLCAVV